MEEVAAHKDQVDRHREVSAVGAASTAAASGHVDKAAADEPSSSKLAAAGVATGGSEVGSAFSAAGGSASAVRVHAGAGGAASSVDATTRTSRSSSLGGGSASVTSVGSSAKLEEADFDVLRAIRNLQESALPYIRQVQNVKQRVIMGSDAQRATAEADLRAAKAELEKKFPARALFLEACKLTTRGSKQQGTVVHIKHVEKGGRARTAIEDIDCINELLLYAMVGLLFPETPCFIEGGSFSRDLNAPYALFNYIARHIGEHPAFHSMGKYETKNKREDHPPHRLPVILNLLEHMQQLLGLKPEQFVRQSWYPTLRESIIEYLAEYPEESMASLTPRDSYQLPKREPVDSVYLLKAYSRQSSKHEISSLCAFVERCPDPVLIADFALQGDMLRRHAAWDTAGPTAFDAIYDKNLLVGNEEDRRLHRSMMELLVALLALENLPALFEAQLKDPVGATRASVKYGAMQGSLNKLALVRVLPRAVVANDTAMLAYLSGSDADLTLPTIAQLVSLRELRNVASSPEALASLQKLQVISAEQFEKGVAALRAREEVASKAATAAGAGSADDAAATDSASAVVVSDTLPVMLRRMRVPVMLLVKHLLIHSLWKHCKDYLRSRASWLGPAIGAGYNSSKLQTEIYRLLLKARTVEDLKSLYDKLEQAAVMKLSSNDTRVPQPRSGKYPSSPDGFQTGVEVTFILMRSLMRRLWNDLSMERIAAHGMPQYDSSPFGSWYRPDPRKIFLAQFEQLSLGVSNMPYFLDDGKQSALKMSIMPGYLDVSMRVTRRSYELLTDAPAMPASGVAAKSHVEASADGSGGASDDDAREAFGRGSGHGSAVAVGAGAGARAGGGDGGGVDSSDTKGAVKTIALPLEAHRDVVLDDAVHYHPSEAQWPGIRTSNADAAWGLLELRMAALYGDARVKPDDDLSLSQSSRMPCREAILLMLQYPTQEPPSILRSCSLGHATLEELLFAAVHSLLHVSLHPGNQKGVTKLVQVLTRFDLRFYVEAGGSQMLSRSVSSEEQRIDLALANLLHMLRHVMGGDKPLTPEQMHEQPWYAIVRDRVIAILQYLPGALFRTMRWSAKTASSVVVGVPACTVAYSIDKNPRVNPLELFYKETEDPVLLAALLRHPSAKWWAAIIGDDQVLWSHQITGKSKETIAEKNRRDLSAGLDSDRVPEPLQEAFEHVRVCEADDGCVDYYRAGILGTIWPTQPSARKGADLEKAMNWCANMWRLISAEAVWHRGALAHRQAKKTIGSKQAILDVFHAYIASVMSAKSIEGLLKVTEAFAAHIQNLCQDQGMELLDSAQKKLSGLFFGSQAAATKQRHVGVYEALTNPAYSRQYFAEVMRAYYEAMLKPIVVQMQTYLRRLALEHEADRESKYGADASAAAVAAPAAGAGEAGALSDVFSAASKGLSTMWASMSGSAGGVTGVPFGAGQSAGVAIRGGFGSGASGASASAAGSAVGSGTVVGSGYRRGSRRGSGALVASKLLEPVYEEHGTEDDHSDSDGARAAGAGDSPTQQASSLGPAPAGS